jgi:hypothetical protein
LSEDLEEDEELFEYDRYRPSTREMGQDWPDKGQVTVNEPMAMEKIPMPVANRTQDSPYVSSGLVSLMYQ